jgi:hypothetical protein
MYAAPKLMLALECWRPDRRVVRVSFTASKRPLLHVVSAPQSANLQSAAIDTDAVSAIAFTARSHSAAFFE